MKKPAFNRLLLKLSGESLAGEIKAGINPQVLRIFAEEIKKAYELGVEIGIVLGGGNIFRGLSTDAVNMDRVTADHMGMLSTVINSLALKDMLMQYGMPAKVMSSIQMDEFAEHYVSRDAKASLSAKDIVIIAGGTGNPFFTTDTAAVLRAIEINADVVLKGTRVDGVYNADPEKVEDAFKFDELTYMEVVKKGLKVMDTTAITLAMENELPVIVFNFNGRNNLKRIISGESIGTKVQG